jgi:hypothetical protein
MIGAAIRYAEIVNTTIGMMIGTCNKHDRRSLREKVHIKLSQRNLAMHVRDSANKKKYV